MEGQLISFFYVIVSFFVPETFLLMSPVKQMLQRASSPVVLMFGLFFNYLSIVEICIDKGLSGGDLCSCQLSQRNKPLTPTPSLDTNWIDRHAKRGLEAFSWVAVMVREHGGQKKGV